eukprot:50133-Eustigmatos_ZCMA.PRE.1
MSGKSARAPVRWYSLYTALARRDGHSSRGSSLDSNTCTQSSSGHKARTDMAFQDVHTRTAHPLRSL